MADMPAENKKRSAQEKLGTMPIGKLLVTMSVPMMISMFIQALYNAVDSMFVARLSEDALTAVSLALPIQNLMIALAVGTGVGVNALVSRSLGEGNRRRAEKAANVQIFIDLIYAILCVGVGLLFSRRFFHGQRNLLSRQGDGRRVASPALPKRVRQARRIFWRQAAKGRHPSGPTCFDHQPVGSRTFVSGETVWR